MDIKVLIVDDDGATREMVAEYIRQWGYKPYTVETVAGALEQMDQEDFHIVVIDKNMPSPMKGIQGGTYIIDHVRKKQPACEVIMMTAFASIESAIETMRAGAFDYIVKPFTLDDLEKKIKRVVEYKKLINPDNTIPIYKNFHTAVLEIFEAKDPADPDKRTQLIKSLDGKMDRFIRRQRQAEYFTIIQQEALSRIAGYAEQINDLTGIDKEVQRLLDKIIEESKKRL